MGRTLYITGVKHMAWGLSTASTARSPSPQPWYEGLCCGCRQVLGKSWGARASAKLQEGAWHCSLFQWQQPCVQDVRPLPFGSWTGSAGKVCGPNLVHRVGPAPFFWPRGPAEFDTSAIYHLYDTYRGTVPVRVVLFHNPQQQKFDATRRWFQKEEEGKVLVIPSQGWNTKWSSLGFAMLSWKEAACTMKISSRIDMFASSHKIQTLILAVNSKRKGLLLYNAGETWIAGSELSLSHYCYHNSCKMFKSKKKVKSQPTGIFHWL